MSEFRKTVLSEDEIKKYSECFNAIDTDKDGYISIKELYFAMRTFDRNLTQLQLYKRNLEMHAKVPGAVNLEEFLNIMANTKRFEMSHEQVREELRQSLKVFDLEGKGKILATELQRIMTTFGQKMTHEEVEEMMKQVEQDKNGMVDCEKLVQMLTHH